MWTEFICTKFATNFFYYVRNFLLFSLKLTLIEIKTKQEDKINFKTTDVCRKVDLLYFLND